MRSKEPLAMTITNNNYDVMAFDIKNGRKVLVVDKTGDKPIVVDRKRIHGYDAKFINIIKSYSKYIGNEYQIFVH